jgi:hypothetical protein
MVQRLSTNTFDAIKAIVQQKKISRVVYMHADHFEPWRHRIEQSYADEVACFGELCAKVDFGRKLSLFYRPRVRYWYAEDPGEHHHIPGEPIVYLKRTDTEKHIARQAIGALLASAGHEIQVHIHHENLTLSDRRTMPELAAWVHAHSNARLDCERFEFFLQLSLDQIREDIGTRLDRWAFVHGTWALNASDHAVCRIQNEMEILKRNGCFGDFSFPAGRKNTNPKIEQPFTCRPITADRAYDLPESEPIPVHPGSNAFTGNRFFIWSSVIKHVHCGIDYYGTHLDALAVDDAVLRWIRDSAFIDGTVYIKTHAHSMRSYYWELPVPLIPHLHPKVQAICAALAEVCVTLNISLEFGTASSIFDELLAKSNSNRPA